MTDLEALADLIERITGNVIPQREMERLRRVATERAAASGQENLRRYVRFLSDRGDTDEWRALLGHITINESYLFRGPQQLAALSRHVLPGMATDQLSTRLRFWSAGCARGEEAVSLAIVLAESLGMANPNWSVLGTDVDENSLDEARLGRYGPRAVARVAPELLELYFTPTTDGYQVVPGLADRITYRPINLVSRDLDLPEAPFSVVFLRNVLIYFRPAAQRRVIERVASTLADQGVLFVGPSESLWQLHSCLEPWDLGDCFCYRRPDQAPAVPGSSQESSAGWILKSEAESVDREPTIGDGSRPVGEEWLPREELIRRAASLTKAGDPSGAASLVVEACRRTPIDAGLRAIEGRTHDLSDEPDRAIGAYRAALYLEPKICVVRYLLADCLLRLGRKSQARRQLHAVLATISAGQCKDAPELGDFEVPRLAEIENLSRGLLDPTT